MSDDLKQQNKYSVYSDPKRPESADELTSVKFNLIRAFPFMGYMILTTNFLWTTDIPTMSATTVGGNRIFINEDFINDELKSNEERCFVIVHEILHIFLEHIGRQTENNYHAGLWNVATDYAINSYIKNLKSEFLSMPETALFEERFQGWSADAIYHKLLEENNNNAEAASQANGGDKIGESGAGQKPFDEIDTTPTDEATKADNRQKVAASVEQAQGAQKNMGSGIDDLIRAFSDLLESKIPWKVLLADFMTTASKNRYTYERPSRRSYNPFGVVFPSMTGDHINLVFGVDSSGSMSSNDLGEALSELRSIVETFDSWKIDFISCDTQAHSLGQYDSDSGDDFSNMNTDIIGGGGTDMAPMVEYAKEAEEIPNACIIVTDGFIPKQKLEDEIDENIPTLILITSAGNDSLEVSGAKVIQMRD